MRVLVLDGGGQLGAFQWGVMTELHRHGIDYSYFDYYVCVSAGAFNASFFLTEQFEESKRIWLDHLPKRFWKTFKNDMPALEDILKNSEPLNCDLIKKREQKIFVALSNIERGLSDYICLNDEPDIIQALLTSCAIPFLAGPRELHGKSYYDGGFILNPSPLQEALLLDANAEIWVITMRPKGYREGALSSRILSLLSISNPKMKNAFARYPATRNSFLEELDRSHFKIIRPAKLLPIEFRSTNLALSEECFNLGIAQAREFMKK